MLTNKLAKNTFFSFLSLGVRFFLNTIIIFKIARSITVEDFGIFTYAQSLIGMFAILTDLGISYYIIREIANQNKRIIDNFTNILFFKVLLSIFTVVSIISLIQVIGYSHKTAYTILYLTIALIFNNSINLYNGLYRGLEKLEYEAIITSINSLLLFIFVIFITVVNPNVIIIAQGYMASRIAAFIITLYISRNVPNLYLIKSINIQFIKEITKESFPYGVVVLFGASFDKLSTIILEHLRGHYEVGIFQAGMKIIIIGFILSEVIHNSFLPTITRLFGESSNKLIIAVIKMNKYLLTLGISLSIVTFFSARDIIMFIYGAKYIDATIVLQIASLIFAIYFSTTTFSVVLTAFGKQRWRMYSDISTAVISIVLSFILINTYGIIGATLAIVLTKLMTLIIFSWLAYKLSHTLFLDRDFLKILIVGVLLVILALFLQGTSIYVYAIVLLMFFLILAYFIILERDEKSLLIKLFQKFIQIYKR